MDTEALKQKVRAAYSAAAERPSETHAFPVGRAFAESLGYPSHLLKTIPERCIEAFTGVAAIAISAAIPEGGTVLDLGCGAGLDSFISAGRVGSSGRVIGIDFSGSMLERAEESAQQVGTENVLFCQADAEHLPIRDATIDVALVNGIFNLNPAREGIFRELSRVVKPGGAVHAAELIVREPSDSGLKPDSESHWFA